MPKNGDDKLNEILADAMEEQDEIRTAIRELANSIEPPEDEVGPTPEIKRDAHSFTQWAMSGNGKFTPVGSTIPKLPAGIYTPYSQQASWGVEQLAIASDGIYKLPDMATETVLNEVDQFWASEHRYRKHKLLYKRGILLWGPPGGGKTVTVKLLMNELVRNNGLVMLVSNVNLSIMALKAIRRVEPDRRLIVVLEDIDEIINFNGEAPVLSMLDGESNIDNVLNIATTNYPERLGARIVNRPSRFDRRVMVDMPSEKAREVYLAKTTDGNLSPEDLAKWVIDSKDMSIAHLRELVAAVYCLNQPYDEVIDRLQKMSVQPKSGEEFKREGMGFKHHQARPTTDRW